LQKSVVMTVVTDGELRRLSPDEPYVGAIGGLTRIPGAEASALRSAFGVTAALEQHQSLTADEVKFLKSATAARSKVCLLSPSALAVRFFSPGKTEACYGSLAELATAFSKILRVELEALISAQIGYVQLNSPAYDALFEQAGAQALKVPALASAAAFEDLLAVDAALLKGLSNAAAATVGVHVPRAPGVDQGSDRYERLVSRLWEALPADRLLLEYGEETPHDFRSLAALPAGKRAVLGLIRTSGALQELGDLFGRIDQAAKHTAEENLAVSPSRSFSNAGQSADAALVAQRRVLVRASEVVQQFWGLEV
jgi:methionine synthase II (cobalamin-independent)